MLGHWMSVLPHREVTESDLWSQLSFWPRPSFKFRKGSGEVSRGPSGSWLPLAQNNPRAKVARLGEACPEPLHSPKEIWFPTQ